MPGFSFPLGTVPLTGLLLGAAWACLAGCQPHDGNVGTLSPRGGGSETTVVGRVLDDSGRAVAGASIWMRGEDDSPLDRGSAESGSAGEALAYSDADGTYRIDGVPTGLRYLIECRRSEGKAASVFAEAGNQDTVHAPDAVLRPTGALRGRIVVPDSLPEFLSNSDLYVYIPGLWQTVVTKADGRAFLLPDLPAGNYTLRCHAAYPAMLAQVNMLEVPAPIRPGETTDVGELTLPARAANPPSEAYARDSAAIASFGTAFGEPVTVRDFSAVLGNRVIFLYDLGNMLAGVPDRVRELDALEVVYLLNFRATANCDLPFEECPPKSISPALSELPHLRRLWLPGFPAKGYPRWTGSFPALANLELSSAGLDSIPEWVLERKRLTALNLAANPLKTIPASLSGLRELRILDLTATDLESLPTVLPKMKSLQGTNLRYNRICSPTAAETAWITEQDSLWIRQKDPLEPAVDTVTWQATQSCGTP